MIYLLLALTGVVSGFMSGLLGVGGGFLMVPVFIILLPLQFPLETAVLPQVAVATALAATVPATASAVIAQFRRGALPGSWIRRLAPGAALGAALGATVAGLVHGAWVALVFSAYAGYFAQRMLRGAGSAAPAKPLIPWGRMFSAVPAPIVGVLIGAVSAVVGVGGASLTVPYLLAQGRSMEMRTAVAAGSAIGLAISIVGAVAFMLGPAPPVPRDAGLVGLVCWTAAIAVGVPAVALAPLGVAASHRLGTSNLKRAFGAALVIASAITLWKVFF